MKSPALVKVRIAKGFLPYSEKGELKAVSVRIDGLEWKMDGEFKAVHSEIRPPQGLFGFGASAIVFWCGVVPCMGSLRLRGISSDELSESRPFESVAC